MPKDVTGLVDFIEYAEGLKREIRNSWLSDNRQESVAEHSWRLALLCLSIAPKTKLSLNMEKVLRLSLVHDLVEIEAGDIPTVRHMTNKDVAQQKNEQEHLAILTIKKEFPEAGSEIFDLWLEYEEQETKEAQFVKIMDKFEAIIQKYQQSLESFKNQDELNRLGAPKYFERLRALCQIDDYLLKFLDELESRRDKLMRQRLSELKNIRD